MYRFRSLKIWLVAFLALVLMPVSVHAFQLGKSTDYIGFLKTNVDFVNGLVDDLKQQDFKTKLGYLTPDVPRGNLFATPVLAKTLGSAISSVWSSVIERTADVFEPLFIVENTNTFRSNQSASPGRANNKPEATTTYTTIQVENTYSGDSSGYLASLVNDLAQRVSGLEGLIPQNNIYNTYVTNGGGSYGYTRPAEVSAPAAASSGSISSQWTTTGSDISYSTGNVGIGSSTISAALGVIGDGIFTGDVTATYFRGDGSLLTGITSFSTSTTRNAFSSTATGLDYSSSTGAFSLTSGYNIPLTASTTEWASAYANRITSVSNSDGSLTISPTTGAVVASLNLGNANTWTGQQTFNTTAPVFGTMTEGSVLFAGTSGVLSQSNSNLFWDNTNNRLGIGSSTPTATLSIKGTAGVNPFVVASSTGTGLLTVLQNGNVGIGTTTPSAKFAITGTAGTGDIFTVASSTNASQFIVKSSGNVGIGTTTPSAKFSITGTAGTGDIFAIASSTEARILTVTSSGNVGIGTSNPGVKLDVNGSIRIPNDGSRSYFASDNSTFIYSNGSNNLLLGNTAAGTLFQISASAMTLGGSNAISVSSGKLGVNNTSYTGMITVEGNGSNPHLVLKRQQSSDYIQALSSNGLTTYFNINQNGGAYFASNVGIGTTTPSAKLAITGTAGTGDIFAVSSSTNAQFLTVKSSGNVGIGTSTPEFPLDVYSTVSSAQAYGYLNSSGLVGTATLQSNNYSIRAQGRILAPEFNAVSDARLKNVNFSLDPSVALNVLTQLQPISFNWKDQPTGQPIIGFIAQDVEDIIPNAVSKIATSNFTDQRTLDYNQITAVAVGAIKQISLNLNTLAGVSSSTPTSESFATSFWAYTKTQISTWLADATNGITSIFAKKVTTDELCVGNTCVTEDQLINLLSSTPQNNVIQGGSNSDPVVTDVTTGGTDDTTTSTSADAGGETTVDSSGSSDAQEPEPQADVVPPPPEIIPEAPIVDTAPAEVVVQ